MIQLITIALLLAVSSAVMAQGDPRSPADNRRAVLLDNGEVLYGTIVYGADAVELRTGQHGSLRLPRERVVAVESSLSDLFQWQLERLPKDQSRPAIQLAEWCLQHGLTQEAAETLIAAAQLPHDESKLKDVQQRLQQEILRNRLGVAPAETATTGIRHAVPEPPPPINLSPVAILEYTAKIQPLLLNRCTNAGCHGRGTITEFELTRPPSRSPFTKGLTQTNAARAASFINFSSPDNSRLLEMACRAHGNASQAPLTNDQQLRLREWVGLVAGRSPEARSTNTAAATPQSPAQSALAARETIAKAAGHEVAMPTSPFGIPPAATKQLDITPAAQPSTSGQPDSTNPFDPSSYNERYAMPRQPPEAQVQNKSSQFRKASSQ